jgi:hypothetical protein
MIGWTKSDHDLISSHFACSRMISAQMPWRLARGKAGFHFCGSRSKKSHNRKLHDTSHSPPAFARTISRDAPINLTVGSCSLHPIKRRTGDSIEFLSFAGCSGPPRFGLRPPMRITLLPRNELSPTTRRHRHHHFLKSDRAPSGLRAGQGQDRAAAPFHNGHESPADPFPSFQHPY